VDQFCSSGVLGNWGGELDGANSTYFAISRDLGTILATQAPVVWAIGYATDPAINYQVNGSSSMNARSPYYKLQYADDEKLVK
jgi:hypothetical protein